MQKLADISQFESLSEGNGRTPLSIFNPESYEVENATFDVRQNPDGTVTPITPGQRIEERPVIPEWGQSLGTRVKNLETDVVPDLI
jgi:hypothetical protein